MNTIWLLRNALFAEVFISIAILVVMWQKSLLRVFYYLAAFLSVFVVETSVSIAILFFRKEIGISKLLAYNIYACTHWISFFILSALLLLIIYSVFRHAMKPLEGLHRAGKVIFRWVFGASLAVSLIIAIGPHAETSTAYIQKISGQIQQGTSVLTICLLLFVCFAIRYLGLTYRSHIFGISLGLGVFATVSLVETAWFSTSASESLYSPMYLYSAFGACIALLVWGTYFAMPEPERKMVLLPTTSPYFLWNRISEALGDDPGMVAIAGFKPQMLAPAELAMLTAASHEAQSRERAAERPVNEPILA